MDGVTFDRLTKVAVQTSRRGFLGALLGVVMTAKLDPGRDTRAQSGGLVVLGGTCTTTADCEQDTPGMCTMDRGLRRQRVPFGRSAHLLHRGTAASLMPIVVATCGAARRMMRGCCRLPPFPTRAAGQVCTSQ